ncbi:MAG: hypothetical protein HOW73_46520 [Polyangiaceae bacterium]|nr:hypothetical protein [Polyangiaceae bacterium]
MSTEEQSAIIDEKWVALLQRAHGRVRTIAQAAVLRPGLRALYPYQSMSSLGFSRTTTYPYDRMPYVVGEGPENGLYVAKEVNGSVIVEGDLAKALDAVESAIRRLGW